MVVNSRGEALNKVLYGEFQTYPFFYMQSEQGTPFGWSLPVQSIIGSTRPPPPTP